MTASDEEQTSPGRIEVRQDRVSHDVVVMVLGNDIDAQGAPNDEAVLRLRRAVDILEGFPDSPLVTSGWAYRDDTPVSIAQAMATVARRDFALESARIIELPFSRDTVGDAVFLAEHVKARSVIVVTSEFHRERASEIFGFVLGPSVEVTVLGVGDAASPAIKARECASLQSFRETFTGIKPGNHEAIYERMICEHPFYNGVADVMAVISGRS